jgi:hypothetical protein
LQEKYRIPKARPRAFPHISGSDEFTSQDQVGLKMRLRNRTVAFAFMALLGSDMEISAQVGPGNWIPYTPRKTIQLRGTTATYRDSGGIETFTMRRGDERSEMRVQNDYKTGINQFEGHVRVFAGQGTSVHQVFKFLMIVAYPNNGGELRQHSYQQLGTTGIFGKWVRVNTIHNTSTRKADIYIDGQLKGTMDDKDPDSPGGWYCKYGVYNTSDFSQAEWRDVTYFTHTANPNSIFLATPIAATRPGIQTVMDLKGRHFLLDPEKPKPAVGVYWSQMRKPEM